MSLFFRCAAQPGCIARGYLNSRSILRPGVRGLVSALEDRKVLPVPDTFLFLGVLPSNVSETLIAHV